MSLTLHYHPLSSFCQKVLIALYEYETPFESHLLNLGDEDSSSEFKRLWPMGKMPVLRDEARAQTIPESSIIIEYLTLHYPAETRLFRPIPTSPCRRGCATASTTTMSWSRCRRSSPTSCGRPAPTIRTAWRRPRPCC